LLAADTFVFHEGEVSFQAGSNPRKERAMNILRKRYPEYEADVARHVAKNEAYPLRVAATAARFRQSNLPVVLHILHAHGGGTEKHVEELCRNIQGRAKLLIMTPPFAESGKSELQICSVDSVDALNIHLPVDLDFLVSLIQSFGVTFIHIHHVLGYPFDLHYLIKKLGIPFYLTVHDYLLICPRIYLMPVEQNYCGEPEPSKCNQCISVDYPYGVTDIVWWRESHAWLFNDALLVICPSNDVRERCQRYFANAFYRVVAHEEAMSDDYFNIDVPSLNENEPLRVAILGVLARHKGIELIANALLDVEKNKTPLQFQLIGYAEYDLPIVPSSLFSQTGLYIDVELLSK
jgi:glycosyltransferase involved in cell wall biosynthesis